jgi:thiol-disulfide isomerase/thioredoxin
MKASRVYWFRIVFPLFLGFCLLGTSGRIVLRGAQSAPKPAEKPPAKPVAPDDEQKAINDVFRSAENNPQSIIKNLEAFLDRFPKTSRREAVLRTICAYAQEANAPEVILQYGTMLLQITPDDPQLLNMLIDSLTRQNDQPSRTRAIDYTTHLIMISEKQRDQAVAAAGGAHDTSERWADRIATLYARRAGFYKDSGDLDKAISDYEKSYATYATALVAEQLGDAAAIKGDFVSAIDFYLTAFVFPEKNPDPAHRQQVRLKLGSLYMAHHHSEKGLGDLVLAHYDALMPQLAGRFSADQPQNAGRHDPFEFVVERMDGTHLPMANYKGKVLVMDFWATWCGPCRLQGKLVDQVAGNFRANSNIAFLSVNVDQDRSTVPTFLKQEAWTVPVAYPQGLDQLLSVRSLPTLVIFDRQGRMVYREEGVEPGAFVADLNKHISEALGATAGGKQ